MTKLARRHHAGLSFDWFTCKRLGPPRASLDAASPVNSATQRAENEREEERNDLSIAGPRYPVFPRACRRPRRRDRRRPVRRSRLGNSRLRARRGRAVRDRGDRAAQPRRRSRGRALRKRPRDFAAGVSRSLPALGGSGLGRGHRLARIWRHGPAARRQFRLHRDLERRLDGLRALSVAERRRARRPERPRLARSARDLHAQDDQRRMDRHDEPDGAAGGLRPQRGQDARRAGRRRNLSRLRPEDLHHLWRA